MADDGQGEASGSSAPTSVAHRQIARSRGGKRSKPRDRPSEILRLKPSDAIPLKVKHSDSGTRKYNAHLEISNPSEHRVMFRVRTTKPKRYQAKPSSGIIDSVSIVKVQIAVGPEAAAQLAQELAGSLKSGDDKFRVESIVLEPNMLSRLAAASRDPTTQSAAIASIWKEGRSRAAISSNTMPVKFPDPQDATPRAHEPEPSPEPTPVAEAPAPAAQPASQPPQIVEPAPAPAPAPVAASVPAMEELRKQYDDLVAFTLTTAAQHDDQITRSNLALEAANKRYEEAMKRIKELESGGARRRRVGKSTGDGASETKDSSDGTASADNDNVRVVRSGFPLWQLVLIAIVMFVLGTLMHSGGSDGAEGVDIEQ